MTDSQDTPAATRYLIEHLHPVDALARRDRGEIVAWVLVGDIELDDEHSGFHRTAFEAWVGEQTTEPPLGAYRAVKHEAYGSSFVEFELVETREREIRQIERVAPVAEQRRDDIKTLSVAAQTLVEDTPA